MRRALRWAGLRRDVRRSAAESPCNRQRTKNAARRAVESAAPGPRSYPEGAFRPDRHRARQRAADRRGRSGATRGDPDRGGPRCGDVARAGRARPSGGAFPDPSREATRVGLRQLLIDEVAVLLLDAPRAEWPPPPRITLMVGVNGSGKTTSAAKLAHASLARGERVLFAAADTFRAAAAEQLQVWGERLGVDVVRRPSGGDPAAARVRCRRGGQGSRLRAT